MSIKKLKPSDKYVNGKYRPTNREKYIGDPDSIIFRSSWEFRFCQYCDLNTSIVKWSSEPIWIEYWNPIDKKTHKYHPDYYIKVRKDDGTYQEWILEIKPKRQYRLDMKPVLTGKVTEKKLKSYNEQMTTWITNRCKFEAATKFAESRGYKFGAVDESFVFS
jgi:hypothetical protein